MWSVSGFGSFVGLGPEMIGPSNGLCRSSTPSARAASAMFRGSSPPRRPPDDFGLLSGVKVLGDLDHGSELLRRPKSRSAPDKTRQAVSAKQLVSPAAQTALTLGDENICATSNTQPANAFNEPIIPTFFRRSLFQDRFGNYIIQRALGLAEQSTRLHSIARKMIPCPQFFIFIARFEVWSCRYVVC